MILLLHETKLQAKEMQAIGQRQWKNNEAFSVSSRGASKAMLQTSCQGIYRRGSGKKFIGNIGENIGNCQKISAKINLELKNYKISDKSATRKTREKSKISRETEIFATLL